VADFYAEDPVAFRDLDPSPEMPRLHLDAVDVQKHRCPSVGLFAGKLRTGSAVIEFVGAATGTGVARRWRRDRRAGRSAGLATRNCVSKGTEFETCGRQTVPCYQFQGGNAGTPIERDISWLPFRGRSRSRLPSQRPP
jgi:hypothetical protein